MLCKCLPFRCRWAKQEPSQLVACCWLHPEILKNRPTAVSGTARVTVNRPAVQIGQFEPKLRTGNPEVSKEHFASIFRREEITRGGSEQTGCSSEALRAVIATFGGGETAPYNIRRLLEPKVQKETTNLLWWKKSEDRQSSDKATFLYHFYSDPVLPHNSFNINKQTNKQSL
jgi:hypothetical protein